MLRQRILTAFILLAGLGGVLFALPSRYTWLAFAGVASLAGWEWGGLLAFKSRSRFIYSVALFTLCCAFERLGKGLFPEVLATALLFWIAVVPLWLRAQWRLVEHPAFGALVGMLVLLSTWIALVILHALSPWLLLAVMAIVWIADIAAYFSGRKFGRHKLAPSISPGKTWEGVAGACTGVVVYGAILLNTAWGETWGVSAIPVLLVLLGLTAVSVLGDLFESMLKRHAGLKDSSNLLPGHGGVLDRIDSLTSTLPVAALILSLAS